MIRDSKTVLRTKFAVFRMIVVYSPRGCFESKNGISRVISEMSRSFAGKLLVIANSYYPEISFRIYSDCMESRNQTRTVARVIKRDDVEILNPHDPTTALMACFLKLYARRKELRVSAFFYDEDNLIPSMGRGLLGRLLQFYRIPELFIRLFLKLNILNEIVVLDKRMLKIVGRRYRSDKIKIVRIGVSPDLLNFGNERRFDNALPTLFFHGILIPRRRVQDLLIALKQVKQPVYLKIGGDTRADRRYYANLVRLTRRLGLEERTHFLDTLDEPELAAEYQSCGIFVFPCDRQTWGIAPLEAMLFKVPVVVSTGCGVSEVLDSRMAILVPPRSPDQLVLAIQRLIDDRQLREELGKNGRDFVLSSMMFQNTARRLEELWAL